MKRERVVKILKKYSQLMRVTKAGEARMGISEKDYDSIADEILSLSSDPVVKEDLTVTDVRRRFLEEFGHEPTSNNNRRWEGVQWYIERIKERRIT